MTQCFPPRVRNQYRPKKQQHLSDLWAGNDPKKNKRSSAGDQRTSRRHNGNSITASKKRPARPLKRIKQKHSKPQMTILDAPGFRDKDVPRFLRIASRRSGTISSAREQDATKKFFRLASVRDTQDVNDGLRQWSRQRVQASDAGKRGSIPSRTRSVPQRHDFDIATNSFQNAHSRPEWLKASTISLRL